MTRSVKSFPNQSGAVTTVVCSLPKLELSVPTDLLLDDEERAGAAALKKWVWTHCQDALLEALTVRGAGGKQSAPALVEHDDDDNTMASAHSHCSSPSRHVRIDLSSKALSLLSRKIKTPLISSIAMASTLQDSDRLSDFERWSVESIQRGSEHLLQTVAECQEYSRLLDGRVPVNIGMTSLQEILNSVVGANEKKAAASGNVSIDTCYDASVPASVSTDGRRILKILHHLLEHAINLSEDHGFVKLGISAVPQRDNNGDRNETFLRFVVKNTCRGIETDKLGKLFDPFRQQADGTGLGMAIAARLVEDLGGAIQVKNKGRTSITVTVDIPVGGKPVDTRDFAQKLQRATVWIVGNDPIDNLFLCMLAKYGVDMVKLDSCGDMEALIQSQKAIDKQRVYLCLVQEDLYRPRAFQKLSESAPSVLLTFGPHRLVSSAKSHFPSLTRTLPSVIAKAMIACFEVAARTHDFTLRRAPSARLATAPRLRSFNYSQVRALIADDGAMNVKLLQRMLRRKGVKHIDVVDDGQKAVDAVHLQKKDYDCIFMDNLMPQMDGLEACQLILDGMDNDRPQPEIVFITGDVSESFRQEAIRAGANGFITKPFTSTAIETYFQNQTKLTKLVG